MTFLVFVQARIRSNSRDFSRIDTIQRRKVLKLCGWCQRVEKCLLYLWCTWLTALGPSVSALYRQNQKISFLGIFVNDFRKLEKKVFSELQTHILVEN